MIRRCCGILRKEQSWIKYLRKSRKINVLINRER